MNVKEAFLNRLTALKQQCDTNLTKSQSRYKSDYDSRVRPKAMPEVGSYVYCRVQIDPRDEEGHRKRRYKLRSKAKGPHRVLRTDSSNNSIVIQRGREEERISLQHATPAPHVKSTSFDNDAQVSIEMPGTQPRVDEPRRTDFHVIDNVVGDTVRNGKPEFKIRWFNFGPQHDTWGPPNHIPRNFVVRYCKQRHTAPPPRD